MKHVDESLLLELLETDPVKGLALLEQLYSDPVRFAASQRLDCAEDIRACVQDTFTDFYLQRERFDPTKGSLRGYLTAISERKAIRRWRENQKQWLAVRFSERSENDISRWEQQEQFRQALDKLPELDRRILQLKYFEGHTVREIAGILGIEYERTKKRLQRALKKLPKLLE